MGNDLDDRCVVLWSVLPVLLLELEYANLEAVGCLVGIDIELYACAEVKNERVGLHGSGLVGSARTQNGGVVHLNALHELTAVGGEHGKAVEPDAALLHDAVEDKCAGPHVSGTRIGLLDSGHDENTVALLHQTHVAAEGSASECVGEVLGGDVVVVVVALHP